MIENPVETFNRSLILYHALESTKFLAGIRNVATPFEFPDKGEFALMKIIYRYFDEHKETPGYKIHDLVAQIKDKKKIEYYDCTSALERLKGVDSDSRFMESDTVLNKVQEHHKMEIWTNTLDRAKRFVKYGNYEKAAEILETLKA